MDGIEEGGTDTKSVGIRNHFLYRETEVTGVIMKSRLEQLTQENSKAFTQYVRLTGRLASHREGGSEQRDSPEVLSLY